MTANPLPGFNNDAVKVIQNLQHKVKSLTEELLKCQLADKLDLHLRRFQNKHITCNDGSTAGYVNKCGLAKYHHEWRLPFYPPK